MSRWVVPTSAILVLLFLALGLIFKEKNFFALTVLHLGLAMLFVGFSETEPNEDKHTPWHLRARHKSLGVIFIFAGLAIMVAGVVIFLADLS